MQDHRWETFEAKSPGDLLAEQIAGQNPEAEQRAREKAEEAIRAHQQQVIFQEWYLRQQMIQQYHHQMMMGTFIAQDPQPQIAHIPPEGYCIDCGGATNRNPKHPDGKHHIRCTKCFNYHMEY